MYKLICLFLIWCTVIFLPVTTFSQYILNGNASKESCNCYLLTNAQEWQGGSVWQDTKIDLNKSFDFNFNVYLGNLDESGADGMVFMLQPLSTSLGAQGEGMGFEGVLPSIGISLDTWQNANQNDPDYDHISIQANGVIKHGHDIAGPVPASVISNNIEDGRWHILRIKWDATSKTISTYFDDVLRLTKQIDLVTAIFNNDPMVYWGFSAATGGSFNLQRFCTALNPALNSSLTNNSSCIGTPITFEDNSVSFTTIKSYYWDFGDGTISTDADPPPHFYKAAGTYEVSHSITAMDNCQSSKNTRQVHIGDAPELSFKVFDTCQTLNPRIDINAKVTEGSVNQWNWQLNGSPFSTDKNPDFTRLSASNYLLKLQVGTTLGCVSNDYSTNFNLKPAPSINADVNDGCKEVSLSFNGQLSGNLPAVKNWKWNFGDSSFSDLENTQHIYPKEGNYQIQLSADGVNGCTSTVTKNIFINAANANAGNDTLVVSNSFFQLNGSGGSSYSWTPIIGLDNPEIANPTAKISNDMTYLLTVKTAEGCVDTASINVTVFKGSAIYVPTAFTPNNDGLNDYLQPHYLSIKTLFYFSIYNRWGEKVFSTNDLNKGWDGLSKNKQKIEGSYVWILKAENVVGQIYNLKGNFVLLK